MNGFFLSAAGSLHHHIMVFTKATWHFAVVWHLGKIASINVLHHHILQGHSIKVVLRENQTAATQRIKNHLALMSLFHYSTFDSCWYADTLPLINLLSSTYCSLVGSTDDNYKPTILNDLGSVYVDSPVGVNDSNLSAQYHDEWNNVGQTNSM